MGDFEDKSQNDFTSVSSIAGMYDVGMHVFDLDLATLVLIFPFHTCPVLFLGLTLVSSGLSFVLGQICLKKSLALSVNVFLYRKCIGSLNTELIELDSNLKATRGDPLGISATFLTKLFHC